MTTLLAVASAYALALLALASLGAVLDRHEVGRIATYLGLALLGGGTALAWVAWLVPRLWPAAIVDLAPEAAFVRAVLASLPLSLVGLGALLGVAAWGGVSGPFDGALAGAALGAGAGVGVTGALAARLTLPAWEAPSWPIATTLAWGTVLGLLVGELRLEGRALRRMALTGGGVAGACLLAAGLAAASRLQSLAFVWQGPLGRWMPLAWLAGVAALIAVAMAVERRVILQELAEEARHGVLPEPMAAPAASWWRRVRSGWWPRGDERREINRMLTSLAFRKRRWRQLPEETARVYGLELGRLRERIRAVLNPRAVENGDED